MRESEYPEDGGRVVGGLGTKTEFYFVRHGAITDKAVKGMLVGQQLDPLTSFGDTEHGNYNHRLQSASDFGLPTDAEWYCSPMTRTRMTARVMRPDPRHNAIEDVRLREMNYGILEGAKIKLLLEPYGGVWYNFFKQYLIEKTPQGESFNCVKTRARNFLFEKVAHPVSKQVVVVSHRGFIQATLANLLEMPDLSASRTEIDYLGITRIDFLANANTRDSRWVCRYVNRRVV